MQRGFDQSFDGVNDGRGAHGVGFDDVQAPAFALGGVEEKVRVAKAGVLFLFREHAGEVDFRSNVQVRNAITQSPFLLASADDRKLCGHAAIEQFTQRANGVVNAFVGSHARHDDQAERSGQRLAGQIPQSLGVHAVGNDLHLLDAMVEQFVARAGGGREELGLSIEPMRPALLDSTG